MMGVRNGIEMGDLEDMYWTQDYTNKQILRYEFGTIITENYKLQLVKLAETNKNCLLKAPK